MPDTRVQCLACGTEQERPAQGVAAVCEICGTPFGTQPTPPTQQVLDVLAGGETVEKREPPKRLRTFAELLVAPTGGASKEIEEIREAEKLGSSLLSLVPIWGPWRLWQSEAHSDGEKIGWTATSVALTLALVIGLAWLIPGAEERAVAAKARVESDFDQIAAFVERYAADTGRHPDADVWNRTLERGDPRFLDPWNRAYEYRLEPDRFVLGTLGRDGRAGGSGEDRDLSREAPIRRSEGTQTP